jgi:hypothetical protein
MEDIKLSEESKDRILNNISGHYAKAADEKTTRIRRINFATKWVAVAAAVLLLCIATPIGVKLVRDNSKKEAKGNPVQWVTGTPSGVEDANMNGQEEPESGKKSSSVPGAKGENDGIASQEISKEDRVSMLNEGKYSSAECTACRYNLEGKTPEQFLQDTLGTPGTDWLISTFTSDESGPAGDDTSIPFNDGRELVLVKKDGKITNAYVVNGDEILVCSFTKVISEEAAVRAARNILGFMLELK